MYSCSFWCEFIDLVGFFDSLMRKLIYRTHFRIIKRVKGQTKTAKKTDCIDEFTPKNRNTSKVSLLYLFYRKISK